MARIEIYGDLSFEQAKCFAEWFNGQGEQDAVYWFEERYLDTPNVLSVREDENSQTVSIEVG